MERKIYSLRSREVNRDIFEAIRGGKKKVETRAATEKYRGIKSGDTVVLNCAGKSFRKKVGRVERCRSIGAVLKKYKPERINPKTHTAKEAREMWYSFPGYREKIKHGLVVLHLN